jgi:hypothetical protein
MDFPHPCVFFRIIKEAWDGGTPYDPKLYSGCIFTSIRQVPWDPTAEYAEFFGPWMAHWAWKNVEWLLSMLAFATQRCFSIQNILRRYQTTELFALAEVGVDAICYLGLACRRLLTLKSGNWTSISVYPEEQFILNLDKLGWEVVIAMEVRLEKHLKSQQATLEDESFASAETIKSDSSTLESSDRLGGE